MSNRSLYLLGATIGGTIGGFLPGLWGSSDLGISLIWSTIGGAVGIWAMYKLAN